MLTDDISSFLANGLNSGDLLTSVLFLMLYAIIVAVIMSVFAYVVGWFERKAIARIQHRHGPTYVGKYGFLQNFADLIKLLSKQTMPPENSDRLLFALIPILLVSLTIFIIFLLPLSPTLQATNLGFGILIVLVLLSFTPILIFIAAFSSGNKFADIGGQRSVMLLISYEMPMVLVMAGIVLLANSYNIQSIVSAQSNGYYFVILMPLGFAIFFITMLAEMERPPFDLREADSELIAGWLTDISANYYAVVLLLDYMRMFLGSLLLTIFFFGGWSGPILPGVAWLIIKAFIISFFIIIVRATTMRMRTDRVLRFGWTVLLPLSLINLIITYMLFK